MKRLLRAYDWIVLIPKSVTCSKGRKVPFAVMRHVYVVTKLMTQIWARDNLNVELGYMYTLEGISNVFSFIYIWPSSKSWYIKLPAWNTNLLSTCCSPMTECSHMTHNYTDKYPLSLAGSMYLTSLCSKHSKCQLKMSFPCVSVNVRCTGWGYTQVDTLTIHLCYECKENSF